MTIIRTIKRNISNLPGWLTNRKIIVIESDDWGSIRMPSREVFKRLEKAGLDLRSWDAERYNLNDSLATGADLEKLFEVLSGFKDKNRNCVVYTPIAIVANPDFHKIKESDFRLYFYEPFTETLKRYAGCERSFDLWKEGIQKRLFVPQMHGREHLNVAQWMKALQNNDRHTRLAFHEEVTGFVPAAYPSVDYQAAFLLSEPGELEQHSQIITEGLRLFENIFGYKAEYFVPPNGAFNNRLNKVLVANRIRLRSAAKIQSEPLGYGKNKMMLHWMGKRDRYGLRYITRNCLFEPGQPGKDWVNSCLYDIDMAFRWLKPAIISTHRVNYMGSLNSANRDNGLRQLSRLLHEIIKKWPDMEFMTTPDLGQIMIKKE